MTDTVIQYDCYSHPVSAKDLWAEFEVYYIFVVFLLYYQLK